MKKTFFNISTRGGDLQTPTKTKRKFLRTFSFTSLALLMGAAGVFAFAPLGASTSVANANELETTTTTETGGLIVPKKDDPVIYTTESGLEIKWGNALPSSANNYLTSGNLKGFPYFTTTNGSTTYTWVIIGKNPSLDLHSKIDFTSLFSTWKTNSTYFTNGSYFFNNTYETATPAGSAINGIVPSKSYVADYSNMVVPNEEIPSGCVLALSNASVGTSAYYSGATTCTTDAHTFIGSSNTLRATCANYYTNDTFGFGAQKSSLQNISLKQILYPNDVKKTGTTQLYFFPLDCAVATGEYFSQADYNEYLSYCNFKVETYLTKAQRALANYVQGRTMAGHKWHPFKIFADGSIGGTAGRDANTAEIVRPACVIKVT